MMAEPDADREHRLRFFANVGDWSPPNRNTGGTMAEVLDDPAT